MMIRTDVIVPEKRIKQHGNRFLKIFVVQQPKCLKKKIVYNPIESAVFKMIPVSIRNNLKSEAFLQSLLDLYIHSLTVL